MRKKVKTNKSFKLYFSSEYFQENIIKIRKILILLNIYKNINKLIILREEKNKKLLKILNHIYLQNISKKIWKKG